MKTSAIFSLPLAAAAAFSLFAGAAGGAEPAADAAARPAPPLIGPPASGGLTAEQVAQRAASTSHAVRARREERAAADAGVDQARASFIPRVTGTARFTRLSSVGQPSLGNLVVASPDVPPGPLPANAPLMAVPLSFPQIQNQYTSQAQISVPVSDYFLKLPQLQDAAKASARSAALLERAEALNVATNGRIAYYDWVRARLQAEVAAQSLAQAQGHLKDVQAANSSGSASKADVLRVESQVANAELQVTRARSNTEILEKRLRILMHDRSGGGYEIGEDLRVVPVSAPQPASPDALVAQAIKSRLETRAILENAEATRLQARAARASELPRLDAIGTANDSRPNSRMFPQKDEFRSSWDASLQVSWSPTDIFGVEASRRGTMARSRQLEAQHDQLADDIELDIRQNLESLHEADTAMRTSERGLASAEESYRVRRLLFLNGRATSVELTDAETERSRAQLEVIGARIDHRIAEVRLAHATGSDVR